MKSLSQKPGPVAGYQRIEADLRKRVKIGHWPIGAMLPSRRDLAREYKVSPATMERAITPLIADGTLRSDDRRGTFVAIPRKPTAPIMGELVRSAIADDFGPMREVPAKAMTIGVVGRIEVNDLAYTDQNSGWVRLIVQAMERAFSSDGKSTIFFNRMPANGGPLIPLADAIVSAIDEGIDALVVVSLDLLPAQVDEALSVLGTRDIPAVCVLAGELTRPVPHVFYDNTSAGYQAAHHLILRGHDRISFVAPFSATWVTERLDGIKNAVEHAGLSVSALDLQYGQETPWDYNSSPEQVGYNFTRRALERGWQPADALICVSDATAFGVIQALADFGMHLTTDYAMVGFDDHHEARTRRLTSMRPPVEAMGQEAARLLLLELHGEPVSTQVRLRAHLIPRESTRPTLHTKEHVRENRLRKTFV
ncbi:MAG TPA: LacI family DNA-binding transcriptional regulator [Capsulimonadaceae bacterium]|nr:LacI family DNA-binding transcriptional regulator [Capsulimonadaceae bacterium]